MAIPIKNEGCISGVRLAGNRDGRREVQARAYPLWELVKGILSDLATDPEQILPLLTEQVKNPENRRTLELRQEGILDQLAAIKRSVAKLVALYAVEIESVDTLALEEIGKQMDEMKARKKSLESDLEEIELGLKACYHAEIQNEQLNAVCRKLGEVIESASDDEWRGLLREFGAKVIINQNGEHTLQVSLNVEPSPDIVTHQSG